MDISQLFKWKTEYTLVGSNKEELTNEVGEPLKVYLRIIGDNDLDLAKRYALKESKRLREQYRKESGEILPDFDEFTQEELAALLVMNEASMIYKQAERDTEVKYPTSTESLFLEDEENYSDKAARYFDELVLKIDENAQKILDDRKNYYVTLSKDALLKKVIRSYIDKIVESDMIKIYNDAILAFAVYEDPIYTKKIFANIDEARNASQFLKEQLYSEYSKLVISDTDLKK